MASGSVTGTSRLLLPGIPGQIAAALDIVVGRRRIELPSRAIALGNFVHSLELFGVLVFETHGPPDILGHVLIRRRIVTTRRLVAGEQRRLPVSIHVAAGDLGPGLGV